MDNAQVIEQIVDESCVSLFRDYALSLTRSSSQSVDEREAALSYCAALGFSGEQMRGTLLLATSRQPLGSTVPCDAAGLREWIAELTNQLLGRIKNQLLCRSVTLHLSTPIVLRGEYLAPLSSLSLVPHLFVCEGGYISVWFDSELAAGIDLSQEVPLDGVMTEGSGELF